MTETGRHAEVALEALAAGNFAAALRSGAPLICPGRDGRRTQFILDATYRSAYKADGGWVQVEPEPE